MPVEILTASLRREWERFPEEIDEAALSAFFSFADDELELIAGHRGVHGRFAIAVAVGAVRWLGFVPARLEELPEPAAALVAGQLDIDLSSIDPKRLHVERDARAEQLAQVITISRFRACRDADLDELGSWVADRGLGHDGPLALLRGTVYELRRRKLMRPGLTVLERLVSAARSEAEREIHRRAGLVVLTPGLQGALDRLLDVPASATAAPVKQLGQETRTVREIGESIEKLELLRRLGAEQWDLEIIPANRRRMLAQCVRHATSQAISRRDPAFRHPALLAFCAEAVARVTDEITDLFDDGVAAQHAKARLRAVASALAVRRNPCHQARPSVAPPALGVRPPTPRPTATGPHRRRAPGSALGASRGDPRSRWLVSSVQAERDEVGDPVDHNLIRLELRLDTRGHARRAGGRTGATARINRSFSRGRRAHPSHPHPTGKAPAATASTTLL